MLSKNLILAVTLVLILINCVVTYLFDLDAGRWAGLITTLIFCLLLIGRGMGNLKIPGAFSFLLFSDILLFYYENSLANTATFLLRISAYLLLISSVFPEIRHLKSSLFQRFIFLLVFSINLVMLVFLIDMVPAKFGYPYMNVLFYAYGISMLALLIAAISYNNRYSDEPSFFFAAAALFLIFSDITSFIAYYLEFYEFYYPDRIFYILGLAGLVKFARFEGRQRAVAELESL